MRVFTHFLFIVLVANLEFAGFRKQKIHGVWPVPWKWSVWRNPNQDRTNQNAPIYLKAILPYNTVLSFLGFWTWIYWLNPKYIVWCKIEQSDKLVPKKGFKTIQNTSTIPEQAYHANPWNVSSNYLWCHIGSQPQNEMLQRNIITPWAALALRVISQSESQFYLSRVILSALAWFQQGPCVANDYYLRKIWQNLKNSG